jgi:hypothetical protein
VHRERRSCVVSAGRAPVVAPVARQSSRRSRASRRAGSSLAVDSYTERRLASLEMIVRTLVISSFATLAFLAALLVGESPTAAENPNQAFAGRIMMSSKRFPQQARSPSAYTAMIRKQAQTNFVEAKDSHSWKIYFAGFLKTPLNDLEYVIKLYELTGKSQQLLVSFDQFTNERGQQTILSNMTLDKKQIGVNKELLMTMESKGKILASSRFKILGEGERFTGKVDFSADDANGKGSDE